MYNTVAYTVWMRKSRKMKLFKKTSGYCKIYELCYMSNNKGKFNIITKSRTYKVVFSVSVLDSK